MGYLCDRYSRRLVSLAAGILLGMGYLLAALTYRRGLLQEGGGPYGVMVVAFMGIGMGTCGMMMASLATCAKNFARSKYKGMAIAVPLAAFGLSGVWLSQVGSRLLREPGPNGERGDLDVYRFFLLLASLLFGFGIIGAMGLRVVAEEELIDEAAEELERSGLLEDTPILQRSGLPENHTSATAAYGAISVHSSRSSVFDQAVASERMKKTVVLNAESRRFLVDRNMWLLALGFFLTIGPGETFIYSLGTIIHSLYPASAQSSSPSFNSPATNVSVVAISSTVARLLSGILSDMFAPQPPSPSPSPSFSPSSPSPQTTSDDMAAIIQKPTKTPLRHRLQFSRMVLLIVSGILLAVGQILLASSAVQHYPALFPVVSALNGICYGAVFALTPIIIGVVWGAQNFGTNWGIVAITPAAGATLWGAVYSVVYEYGVGRGAQPTDGVGAEKPGTGTGRGSAAEGLCYGFGCYGLTFAGMALCSCVAIAAWSRAWRVWRREGVVV